VSGRRIRARSLRAIGMGLATALILGPLAVQAADRQPIVASRGPIAPYMGQRDLSPDRTLHKDAHGVVMASYGGSIGHQYNPVTIAQAAIGYYNGLKYGHLTAAQRTADKAAFFIQVEWLVGKQKPDGRWLYTFPFGGQPIPWASAMAQGQAMSALIRANSLRPDARYTTAIAKSRATFGRVWALGGVSTWQAVGTKKYLVYEEYMAPYSPHTLNGWIFAMVGLHETWTYLKDPKAKALLFGPDRGIAALRTLLPYYDTGSWSTYNLKQLTGVARGTMAKRLYHEVHIKQLRWFAKVTNDSFFEVYADRFQGYLTACLAAGTCPP
jgi:heparosan-N-sulfate-glucuronate 5-epimerase